MNFVFVFYSYWITWSAYYSAVLAKERDVRPSVPLQYIITWRSFTCAAQVEIVLSMCVCVCVFWEERSLTFSAESAPPPKIEFHAGQRRSRRRSCKCGGGGITLKNQNRHCTTNTVWSSSISLSINHHGLSLKSVLFYKLFSWYLSFTITHSSFYCYSNPQER